MSLLLLAIGVCLLWHLVCRLLPITVTPVILIVGALVYVTFGRHSAVSDATTTVCGWIIIAAFGLDIVGMFTGAGRPRAMMRRAATKAT